METMNSTRTSLRRKTLFSKMNDMALRSGVDLTTVAPNGFELSGRGMPDRYLFFLLLSYNLVSKTRNIPGPFQRIRKGTFTPVLAT
jgi:hypothetical protein